MVTIERAVKRCNMCGEVKPIADFHKMSNSPDGHQYRCRPCIVLYKKKWCEANRERTKDQSIRSAIRRYGISVEQYLEMWNAQRGVCFICKLPDQRGDKLHIDHNHACCPKQAQACGKCVRALLCGRCNRGLGMFMDSPELLDAAKAYLLSYSLTPQALSVS